MSLRAHLNTRNSRAETARCLTVPILGLTVSSEEREPQAENTTADRWDLQMLANIGMVIIGSSHSDP